jgi:hypothetical protein
MAQFGVGSPAGFVIPLASGYATALQKVAFGGAAASYIWSAFNGDYDNQASARMGLYQIFDEDTVNPWDYSNGQSSDAYYDIFYTFVRTRDDGSQTTGTGDDFNFRGPIDLQYEVTSNKQRWYFNYAGGTKSYSLVSWTRLPVDGFSLSITSFSVVPRPGYEGLDESAPPRGFYVPSSEGAYSSGRNRINADGYLEQEETIVVGDGSGGTRSRTVKYEFGQPKPRPGGMEFPGKVRWEMPGGFPFDIGVKLDIDLSPGRSRTPVGVDRSAPGDIPRPEWRINLPSPAPLEIAPGVTVELDLLPPAIKVDLEKIPIPGVPRPLRPGVELEFGYDDDFSSPRPISPDPCPDPCPPSGGGDCPDPCPDPCPEQKELKNEERLIGVQVITAFGDLPRNVIEIYEDGENLFVPRLGWVTFIYTDDMGFDWRSPPIDIKRLNSFIPAPNSSDVLWSSYEVHVINGVNLFGSYPVRELRQKNIFEYQES